MIGRDWKQTRLALSVALIAGGLLSAEASAQGNRCTDEAASLRAELLPPRRVSWRDEKLETPTKWTLVALAQSSPR